MTTERTIVLHYHLFKNAGTSLDQILKDNFAPNWVTQEFPTKGGNNTPALETWIADTPHAVAYSSHTLLGPPPRVDNVQVISVMLLRDPIARIRSAYRFERKQNSETWGAQLAKREDFAGYVRARLDRRGDRQCRNFQMHRLASLVPGPAPERERAEAALDVLSVVGTVETFDQAVTNLSKALQERGMDLTWTDTQRNVSDRRTDTDLSPVEEELRAANREDFELWATVAARTGGAPVAVS